MSISVSIELGYTFDVKAPVQEVFDVLANVPDSASHYPGLDRLVDLGQGAYRWEMAPIGVGSIHLQTVYAAHYVSSPSKHTVTWTPVEGVGNALVSGSWKITPHPQGAHLALKIQAELSLPLPGLMKMVVQPLVEAEFEKLTEQYIANLCKRFGGEV